MSSSHEEHNTESKPVSFTVPFIMACAFIVIMLMFLSLCDPSKEHHGKCKDCTENCSKECMEACEKGDHSLHPKVEAAKTEEASEAKEVNANVLAVDSAKSAAPAEEAHH